MGAGFVVSEPPDVGRPNLKTGVQVGRAGCRIPSQRHFVVSEPFERATTRARDLGMSRSEFFATAAQHYLDELDAQSITVQIDTALARLEGTDQSAAHAVVLSHRIVADTAEEW